MAILMSSTVSAQASEARVEAVEVAYREDGKSEVMMNFHRITYFVWKFWCFGKLLIRLTPD
jgi:hypothetical protein